jgi:hypothetical protein
MNLQAEPKMFTIPSLAYLLASFAPAAFLLAARWHLTVHAMDYLFYAIAYGLMPSLLLKPLPHRRGLLRRPLPLRAASKLSFLTASRPHVRLFRQNKH